LVRGVTTTITTETNTMARTAWGRRSFNWLYGPKGPVVGVLRKS
jgi:hypothetical protein